MINNSGDITSIRKSAKENTAPIAPKRTEASAMPIIINSKLPVVKNVIQNTNIILIIFIKKKNNLVARLYSQNISSAAKKPKPKPITILIPKSRSVKIAMHTPKTTKTDAIAEKYLNLAIKSPRNVFIQEL